jgi:rhodanese-related sulfurtransferase
MKIEDALKNPSTFILDVRTPEEFRGGALPRAILIPIAELERRKAELPEDKDTPILVYCAHGVRSLSAMTFLKSLGFTKVVNLDGGLAVYGQKSSQF